MQQECHNFNKDRESHRKMVFIGSFTKYDSKNVEDVGKEKNIKIRLFFAQFASLVTLTAQKYLNYGSLSYPFVDSSIRKKEKYIKKLENKIEKIEQNDRQINSILRRMSK